MNVSLITGGEPNKVSRQRAAASLTSSALKRVDGPGERRRREKSEDRSAETLGVKVSLWLQQENCPFHWKRKNQICGIVRRGGQFVSFQFQNSSHLRFFAFVFCFVF